MSEFNYKVPGDCIQQDIINNTVPETLWQKVYLYLKKLGYDVYAPGQKRNKCTENYVVIKENGVHALVGNISGYKLFDIIVYNPIDQYSTMEFYVENLKEALKKIGDLRPTGNETPSIIDYDVQAYTTSIEYQQFKSLRR
ncbi:MULTISPECIES: hypothetical protein [Clostridium]|uniref:Uncharacterized protein n=1 Tax=Clostridium sporogenes TaxID=1509 RepID=A0A7X5SWM6_CLOSG|nr:hypothetical protein [Clostridium sporogenes]AJD30516.1 hypothetical protein T258_1787 [Clostridium botulinum Prevot_594]AVP61060.1 hypothetical protein C7M79_10235 [Clostridium botulinum]AKC63848.1 hypothetical protein CLSPO_c31290 [Clostridium sporogenes]AKJ90994.1 hypothetical protein CLSPOx_15655 [Clostridium sporogenes]KCZ67546.1 hypothetical protein CSPO_9c05630 [Clostridium sporogenes]